jgi:hypothetical protein
LQYQSELGEELCCVLGAAGGKAKGNTDPDVTAISLIFQVGFTRNA